MGGGGYCSLVITFDVYIYATLPSSDIKMFFFSKETMQYESINYVVVKNVITARSRLQSL